MVDGSGGGFCLPGRLAGRDVCRRRKRGGSSRIANAQREIHSEDVEKRVEGIRRLRDIPGVEAAKVLVSAGLTDSAPAVRRIAYRTLLAWKDDQQIAAFLLRTLNKESRAKKKGASCVVPLAAILLASELPDIQRDLSKFLDAYATSQKGAAALIGVADELGAQAEASSLASLCRMTELKCFADSFACRRAVVQAMVLIREPEAIDALIALLPKVDGEVRGDVLRRLAALSDQWLGTDAKAWQAWWQKHKKDFGFPPESRQSLANAEQNARAVFLLWTVDPSSAGRLCDRHLGKHGGAAAGCRPAGVDARDRRSARPHFFQHRGFQHPGNRLAEDANRSHRPERSRLQRSFIYLLRAGGHTAAYDALEAAFDFDAEAVYFLSDGEPNAGKIPLPGTIIDTVTQINRTRRISIYTIGIIPGMPGGRWNRS